MIKKIYLSLLLGILFVWVSFADVIPIDSHRIDKCVKIENPKIGWYTAIQVINGPCEWGVYVVEKNKCLKQHYHFCDSYIYLIPNSMGIKWRFDLLKNNNILLGEIDPNGGYYSNSDLSYRGINSITEEYEIIRSNWEYELQLINTLYYNNDTQESLLKEWNNIKLWKTFTKSYIIIKLIAFLIAWLSTIIIETLLLFFITKLCRKSWYIKNWKIFVTWVLASTVTLPLLWFVLPIFFSNYWIYVIFWEILVTIIETFIIKYSLKIDWKMAIFASAVCNLCSFLFWLFIF